MQSSLSIMLVVLGHKSDFYLEFKRSWKQLIPYQVALVSIANPLNVRSMLEDYICHAKFS